MNKNQIVGPAIALCAAIFQDFNATLSRLAWIVIGEALSPERIAGMALIVFAPFLSHWKLPRTKPQPAGPP